MRQNRSCRNGRPIKLSNRSGATIQNFYTGEQKSCGALNDTCWQLSEDSQSFRPALTRLDFLERLETLEL
jgi:hypothetical protein